MRIFNFLLLNLNFFLNFFVRYLSKISPRRHYYVSKENNFANLDTEDQMNKQDFQKDAGEFRQPSPEMNIQQEIETNRIAKSVNNQKKNILMQEKPVMTKRNNARKLKLMNGNEVVKPSEQAYNPDVTIIDLKEDKSLINFHRAKVGMKEPLKTSKRFLARKRKSMLKQKKKKVTEQEIDEMKTGVSTFCSMNRGENQSCALI